MTGAKREVATTLTLSLLAVLCFFPTFDDFPVSDCFSLLIKARDLSTLEILHPSQTEYANPYYRPLFVLLLKPIEALAGPGGLLQHILALVAHLSAAVLVASIVRFLLRLESVSFLAALLFLVSPVNTATVAWTTVTYVVLSGVFTLGVVLLSFRCLASPTPRRIGTVAVLQTVALMASQTAYQAAPLLILYALIYGRDRDRIQGLRIVAILFGILAGLTGLSYLFFESLSASTFGLTLGEAIRGLAFNIPRFHAEIFHLPIPPWWVWWPALGLALALTVRVLGRAGVFLLGWSLVGTLPYSLVSYTDRYAYIATVPLFAWAVAMVMALGSRFGTKGVRVAALPVVGSAIALSWAAQQELRAWDAIGRESRSVFEATGRAASRIDRPEQLHVYNLPSFHRWILAYQLRMSPEDVSFRVRVHRHLETERVRFGPLAMSLGPDEILLAYRDGILEEKRPEELRPLSEYPLAAFPTEILVRPSDEEDILQALDRFEGDPESVVVLEERPPGLPPKLAGGRMIRYEKDEISPLGLVEMDSDGLVVLVIPWWPLDPLAAQVRQINRAHKAYEVTVDDRPAKIYPAFYHFVAVVVPKGRHVIRLFQRSHLEKAGP